MARQRRAIDQHSRSGRASEERRQLLQALWQRAALRQHLHQRQGDVQEPAWVRVLAFPILTPSVLCMRRAMAFFAILLTVGSGWRAAMAEPHPVTPADFLTALPGLQFSPSKNGPSKWTLSTWRAPEIQLSPSGFQLAMFWNGLDDDAWPFVRILDSLVVTGCGYVPAGWSVALRNQLFASKSLVPEREMGGNGGVSFKKAITATAGGCRVELQAQGARWNTVSASVTYGSARNFSTGSGVFAYKWSTPFPSEAVTAQDIQQALIWTRRYVGMVDGQLGTESRRAISEWQASKGNVSSGTLSAPEATALISEGMSQRDAYGWAILRDEAIGFSVGVPTKVTEVKAPYKEGNMWWYDATGSVAMHIGVLATPRACNQLDAVYNSFIDPRDGQQITYQARKDDWFVVAGQRAESLFYVRSQCRDQGIVTVSMHMPANQREALSFLFVAMTNSLVLRPVLQPTNHPSLKFETPPLSPGESVSYAPAPEIRQQAPRGSTGGDIDRQGRTPVKLVLLDGADLSARDVFERVSEAVYVVQTPTKQGSAVAVSETTLLTNCHVLGQNEAAMLERGELKIRALLVSANVQADRCVLSTTSSLKKWVRVRPYSDAKVGEKTFTVGAPQGLELTIAEGIVSSKRTLEGVKLLQTSAAISSGSSGGGLFDSQGNLLGITTWMLKDGQNLNFAIAAEEYAK